MRIRKFEPQDLPAIVDIVRSTGVFRDVEIDVARELLEIAVDDPDQKDYVIYSAVDETEKVVGYYCVGPTPLTASTFDLYWIAVSPLQQGKGIGHALLHHCENFVRQSGGTLIMVETSSLPKYDSTRLFYSRHHYLEAARIRDYYAPGDDLVLYTKYL